MGELDLKLEESVGARYEPGPYFRELVFTVVSTHVLGAIAVVSMDSGFSGVGLVGGLFAAVLGFPLVLFQFPGALLLSLLMESERPRVVRLVWRVGVSLAVLLLVIAGFGLSGDGSVNGAPALGLGALIYWWRGGVVLRERRRVGRELDREREEWEGE